MLNTELEYLINQELNSTNIQDHAPNGLQVEGRKIVKRIITGVTASQALIDTALEHNADAIIVHHGYFWKNEESIIYGTKRYRLKTLLSNDINLYAWHLPLDLHSKIGNNIRLAADIGIRVNGALEPLVLHGSLDHPIGAAELKLHIKQKLGIYKILHCGDSGPDCIKQLAWCTGGGQGYIKLAARAGMDAFITGEFSEQAIYVAREMGLHFYSAGHYATERGGIRALGNWLATHHGVDVTFIDIPNPA